MASRHLCLALAAWLAAGAVARADFNEAYEKATKAAIEKVAPSVVQIVTQGGTDLVVTGPKGPTFRKALGPTTGVVLTADGYIISSAFNFINSPTTILVEVPGRDKPYIAKTVATDRSRMLTLLRIDGVQGLKVPEAAPKKDLAVGQWSLALGRTLDEDQNHPPSVSVGVISALNRVWGKCIQTDANTSPVNYGGPLVDIRGRVQGIIVPASPRGDGETAGFEWYDSGIGFAVPMEDVLAVFPRLKQGKDLQRGLLGVRLQTDDIYEALPVIGAVTPDSAAARAGLKPGDTIVEIDGEPVVRMAQILHLLGPKYEGDTVSLKYKRGNDVKSVEKLELVGKLTAVANAFLGILPLRDDPKLGVEVRFVYPKSPAEKAGLKAGDRVVKYGQDKALRGFQGKVPGREELADFLDGVRPDDEVKLELKRKDGKSETVTVKLAAFPGTTADEKDAPPQKLPEVASAKKALEPLETPTGKGEKKAAPKDEEPETGLVKLTTANGNHKYAVYVHDDYDPNVAQALLVWLHPPQKNADADFEGVGEAWDAYCRQHNILIVMPSTGSVNGWVPSDARAVQEVVQDVMGKYTVDEQRVIAHGMGVGGQMAIYMGFNARDLIRGVATTGAVPTGVKDNAPNQRLSLFVVAGDRDPLVKEIAKAIPELIEHQIPAIYRELEGIGRQYLTAEALGELVRWIDALDRL